MPASQPPDAGIQSDALVPGADLGVIPSPDQSTPGCIQVTPGPGAQIQTVTTTTVPNHPTVFILNWKTAAPSTGIARFGVKPQLDRTTKLTATATTHQVLLLGLPATSEVRYQLEVTLADSSCYQAEGSVKTGALPADLPQLSQGTNVVGAAADGFSLVPVLTPQQSWMVILDSKGRYVWFYKTAGTVLRGRFSMDGEAILIQEEAENFGKDGTITRIPLAGGKEITTKIKDGHTDFVEYAHRKYAALSRVVRSFNGGSRKLLGESIMTVEEGGQAKVFWDVFDHLTPDLSKTYNKGTYDPDPDVEAWSHINFISYHAKDQAFLVTARELHAVIKVSLTTGKNLWVMSRGTDSTINLNGDGSMVSGPHSSQQLDNSVLVFNDGPISPAACSSVVEVGIQAGTASALWTYVPKACYQIVFLGDATRLWNGNTHITWSTAGRLEEVTAAKQIVWSVQASLGAGFGFTTRLKSLY